MLFAAPLVISLLVALAAAAGLPSAAGDIPKALRRGTARSHATPPFELLDKGAAAGDASHNERSGTWTGAVYHDFPNRTFTRVTGTIVVPTARPPQNATDNKEYSSSIWVGIDGYNYCTNAILQTGIEVIVNATDNFVYYRAWYEWYPDGSDGFNSTIEIHAGDKLRLTVEATSLTTGTAMIENLSRGGTLFQELSSNVSLCAADAAWIVEDYKIGGRIVPFADFGSVTFSNATATVAPGGGVLGPQYATLIDMYQNDRQLTEASSGLWNVTVNYVG